MKCENCKYKDFYERFKAIDEYVEREATKRLINWIKEGKVAPKPQIESNNDESKQSQVNKDEKSKEILKLLAEYGKKLRNKDEPKSL